MNMNHMVKAKKYVFKTKKITFILLRQLILLNIDFRITMEIVFMKLV